MLTPRETAGDGSGAMAGCRPIIPDITWPRKNVSRDAGSPGTPSPARRTCTSVPHWQPLRNMSCCLRVSAFCYAERGRRASQVMGQPGTGVTVAVAFLARRNYALSVGPSQPPGRGLSAASGHHRRYCHCVDRGLSSRTMLGWMVTEQSSASRAELPNLEKGAGSSGHYPFSIRGWYGVLCAQASRLRVAWLATSK